MNKYVVILTQDRCKNVNSNAQIIIDMKEYILEGVRCYWICDENRNCLGKYATLERAKEVLIEIHESDGKYEMPLE